MSPPVPAAPLRRVFGRSERLRDADLILALALSTCAWWFMFWSGKPGHFNVHDVMLARATLAAHQGDQNESFRVLFPWLYVALESGFRSRVALALGQFIAALAFFSGTAALYRRQRPAAPRLELIAAMSLLCFYSASAYQAGNRWGELLGPGLLALSLAANTTMGAVAALALLGFQRLDYGVLSVFVFSLDQLRRQIALSTVGRIVVRTLPVACAAVILALNVPRDPAAANILPFNRDLMHEDSMAALNPNTWIWWGMYFMPAGLFASSVTGRWNVPFLAGIALNLALTMVFGAWSEFRLLLPTVILLVCCRRERPEP